MSQLVVRNLEAGLIQRLKQRAAEHGVSAEEEHRRILRHALLEPEDDFPDLKALLLAMPDVGEDDDFTRLRQLPPDAPDLGGS
jgi:plasmid stability protein